MLYYFNMFVKLLTIIIDFQQITWKLYKMVLTIKYCTVKPLLIWNLFWVMFFLLFISLTVNSILFKKENEKKIIWNIYSYIELNAKLKNHIILMLHNCLVSLGIKYIYLQTCKLLLYDVLSLNVLPSQHMLLLHLSFMAPVNVIDNCSY